MSSALTLNADSVRGLPVYPRETIAWYTSSDMACALPNIVPAVADTNARPDFTALSALHRAGLAGLVHVGDRAEQMEHVAVRHAEHQDEHPRHEQRSQAQPAGASTAS